MPLVNLNALMSVWLPLTIGALAAFSGARRQAMEQRQGPPARLAFKPKRAAILVIPFAWQAILGADNIATRLFAVFMVMGVGLIVGLALAGLVTALARITTRD